MAARKWTEAQKRAQAAAVRRWSPWKNSTGPRSAEGKKIAARNSFKTGAHSKPVRLFYALMRRHAELCARARLRINAAGTRNELLALWENPLSCDQDFEGRQEEFRPAPPENPPRDGRLAA